MCKSQNSQNSLFYNHFDKYFFKIVLDIWLALTGSTVPKSIVTKFFVTARALPYSKNVCKSQNRKCVCKSHQVCPCVCKSQKNVCVSHKIHKNQVLPRGSGRGGWQWSAMVLIGASRITCKEMTSKTGLKQPKQKSKVCCDLHTFLAWHMSAIFFQLPICFIGNFGNTFCFAMSAYFCMHKSFHLKRKKHENTFFE